MLVNSRSGCLHSLDLHTCQCEYESSMCIDRMDFCQSKIYLHILACWCKTGKKLRFEYQSGYSCISSQNIIKVFLTEFITLASKVQRGWTKKTASCEIFIVKIREIGASSIYKRTKNVVLAPLTTEHGLIFIWLCGVFSDMSACTVKIYTGGLEGLRALVNAFEAPSFLVATLKYYNYLFKPKNRNETNMQHTKPTHIEISDAFLSQ